MKKFSIAMDSSQVSAFMTCPQKWYYEYLRKIQLRGAKRDAFDKGTIIHGMIERYYYHLFYHPTDFSGAQGYALDSMKDLKNHLTIDSETIKFLSQRFVQYTISYFGRDFKVAPNANGTPALELGFSIPILDNSQYLFVLEGRIDAIVILNDKHMFIDHKTRSQNYDNYTYSIQFMNYAIASNCTNGIVNYIGLQDKITDRTFERKLGYYSKTMLDRWLKHEISIFSKAATAIRLKEYEMNESQCMGKFGLCPFTKLCETVHRGTKNALMENYYESKPEWKPWSLSEILNKEENNA